MQLAHAGDDGLARLLVGGHAERRILLGELLQRDAHLVLLGLRLRLDGDVDNRLGELHGLEDDRMVGVAQRVAGGGVLQAHDRDDVARGAAVDVHALVRVHLQKAPDALLLVLRGVHHVRAGLELARVHAQVGQLAHERIGHDLERERAERLLEVGAALVFLARVGVRALDGGDVDRRGHVVHHAVKQLLHAFVLVGRAHEHGMNLAGDGALADGGLQLLDRHLLLHEHLLHERVVAVGGSLEQLLAVQLGLVGELGRNGVHGLGIRHALLVGLEVPSRHGDQVDDAPEAVLGAHGHLHGHGRRAQAVLHRLDRAEEVGAHAVVLVDVGDARHAVAAGLAPHRLGLRLHAGHGVEHRDRAVEHAQAALDLGREVNVAGRVDDLEAVLLAVGSAAGVLPEARGGGSGDGHAALLLLHHPVHRRGAVVHLADLVGLARVVEDALGRRRLARVDVGHDADVARILQVDLCHEASPPLEAVVRERTVRLGHLVQILALLHRRARVLGGVHDLGGEALLHRVLLALAREVDDPADRERGGATGVDLHRHLVGGSANALRLDFERGAHVVHGLLEDGQRVAAGLLLDDGERAVDDVLGHGLLAVEQDLVDQLRDEAVVVLGVRLHFAADCCCTTRHVILLLAPARFRAAFLPPIRPRPRPLWAMTAAARAT